ncbi:alpha/beta hydrolase family protein [Brevundimonas lenta]|uniref:Serine aminopeptidase S33 domain-containing protein n=1 Tax=Brevundimonas lenta TaxID=424796 RepID=A0A7W6NMX9_9CAUL|nr:alpha/beta hydrolase [Brevundimonas lenta]MBB4081213.1 hypothetical protein [Brevundimonas lenta]
MKPIIAFAACALALLAASAALADPASPAGDWQGVISARGTRAAIHIEQTASGAFVGDIDLPDNGIRDFPLDQVTLQDGVLAFSYRGGTRRFEGRWDEAAGAWVGRFQTPNSGIDMAWTAGFLGLPVVDGLDGRWEGVMSQGGVQTRVILRVDTDEHGTWALLDLPHLVEIGIPVNPLTRQGDAVAFTAPAAGLGFQGALDPAAGTLKGTFGAPGSGAPLELVRNDDGEPRRPQTPTAPWPYRTEEISIANAAADVRLGCTLTLPQGPGSHAVAILLSGTAAQDRDEEMVGHRPFLVLADHLARNGVGALRCDDRGVGASTGVFRTSMLPDFADDVEASMDVLQARPDVGKIGLIGHSEGGIVASMVAAERADAAFVVQVAGPGVPVYDLLLKQGEETSRARGLPEAMIEQQSALRRAVYDIVRAAETPEAGAAEVEIFLVSVGLPRETAQGEAAFATRPDMQRILKVDPAAWLAQVSAPVLAIVGSKDTQVPAPQNLPGLRAALAGNPDATVLELPDLNHLMQTARTGAIGEYYEIEETMAPLALATISTWLAERGFARATP